MQNPYAAYRQQSVKTMTTGDMLRMLYDEMLKRIGLAIEAIKSKDIAATNENLKKAQEITNHLISSLDMKYEISENLRSLYDFFNRTLIKANVEKNAEGLEELIPLVTQLRDAYVQADRSVRTQSASSPAAPGTNFGGKVV